VSRKRKECRRIPAASDALTERIRSAVREELRQGAEPADLSFVLAFVATELGLTLASIPWRCFP